MLSVIPYQLQNLGQNLALWHGRKYFQK